MLTVPLPSVTFRKFFGFILFIFVCIFFILISYIYEINKNVIPIMDYSTISTNSTVVEDIPDGELGERYNLLKKQHETLTRSFESTKQELHDVRRSYQTSLDVQSHMTAELEAHQSEEAKRRNELTTRISNLQEELSALREERVQITEQHSSELSRLQQEVRRLKEETSKTVSTPIDRDNSEIEEARAMALEASSEANVLKENLEQLRVELETWKMATEALKTQIEEFRQSAEIYREELKAANERETVALAELTEAKALLHQCNDVQDLQPHAVKGNSLFAEVEDKRQEMAKTLIQMKQTNSKLRRELANKQAEVETLLHEKQTIWEQQLGAAAHYDREMIETYEGRISQLEALAERQRRELARWFARQSDAAAGGWLPGVLEHFKNECDSLRQEVLARGAAGLASAAQIRELRRKLLAVPAPAPAAPAAPPRAADTKKVSVSPQRPAAQFKDITNIKENMAPKIEELAAKRPSVDDTKKRVTFT